MLSGTEAFNLGFVDELGNFQDAVKRAKLIAGIGNANLIQYQQRYDLAARNLDADASDGHDRPVITFDIA